MRNKHVDPTASTILQRAILFPVLFLSIAFLVFSFSASIAWAAAPNPPSNLTATVVSSSEIDLSWTDDSNDESGFSIERKTGASGTYAVIGNFGPSVKTYSNKNLIQTTTYYYRVRAYSGSTYSTYTNEVSVTTLPMNPPSGLTATVASSSEIDLSWTDNSNDESGFSIERKTGASGTYAVIGSFGPNTTTYSNKNLIQTTTYYYRVRAMSGTTYSAYTNEVSATALPMNPPSGLTATVASSSEIDLSWTDNSNDESGFSIERKTGASGTYAVIGSFGPNTTTYSNKNLIQTLTYYYRVRAMSGTTYSAYTNEVSVTTLPMNPPSGLTATVASSSEIDLSWTDNSNDESGFSIERKTGASGTYAVIGSFGPNTTTYSNKNLIQTLTYYYRVRAMSGTTYSAYTNEVNASTGADITPPTGSIAINGGAAFTNTTALTLTLSATDTGSGVSQMQFSNDGSTWSTPEAYATLKSWTMTTGDGTKTVYAKFKDNANNWSNAIPSNTITLDTTPPLVTISSPASGFTNNKTPLLNYAVSDGTVVVKLDGIVVPKISGNSLDTLTDGQHTIRVESTDAANNVEFASVNITVDTIAPAITVTAPTAGYINNKTPLLNYTVSDGTIVVRVDGAVVSKVSGTNLDALPDGPHIVRVESTDAANNIGYVEVNFTVDTTPPAVTITSPVTGLTNSNAPLLIYNVSDGMVVVKVDGIVVNKVSGNNLDILSFATHTVRVESTDAANNTGYAEVTFTVIDQTLVGLWHMDGDWIDASGNVNNGTAYNGATCSTNARVGSQAGSFDGVDDYVIAGSGLMSNVSNTFTIAFWANPTASRTITNLGTSGQRYAVAPNNGGDTDAGAGVSVGNNGIGVFEQGTNYLPSLLDYNVPLSGWTHVVVVYENKLPKLYVNGQFVMAGAVSQRTNVHPSMLFGNVSNYGPYQGLLDEVAIYSRVLTGREIINLYAVAVPYVQIISPSGPTNNNAPLLVYSVVNGTVTAVKVDGIIVSKVLGNTLDILSDGTHTLRVEAVNSSGTVGFAEMTFTVDTVPPTVSVDPVTSPTNSTTQTVTGRMETGAAVTVSVDTIATPGVVTYPTVSTWSCTIKNLASGSNNITVTALDAAGNSTTATASILQDLVTISHVTVDPTEFDLSYGQVMTVRYTIDRPANVNVTLQLATPAPIPLIITLTSGNESAGTHEISQWNGLDSMDSTNKKFVINQDGYYTIKITADDSGNHAEATAYVRIRQ